MSGLEGMPLGTASLDDRDYEPLGPVWAEPLDAAGAQALLSGLAACGRAPQDRIALAGTCTLHINADSRFANLPSRAAGPLWPCVAALGAFDGVHLGHRALVEAAVSEARRRGIPAIAATFDPDPAYVLGAPAGGADLLCAQDRVRLLLSLGLDGVLVIPFTTELAHTGYQAFVRDVLVGVAGVCSLHVGADFRMGAGGAGNVEALTKVGAELGMSVCGHELVGLGGRAVTATRTRGLIAEGSVADAACLLGRAHFVRGKVAHGRGEGGGFGFPTANIVVGAEACLPAEGVYAAFVGDGERAWPAAVNVGAPRSFGGGAGAPLVEATLLGFEGDLYERELSVAFVEWLREPRSFASTDELVSTVLGNVSWVRHNLGDVPLPCQSRWARRGEP